MFLSNGYLIWFFSKFLQQFLTVDNDISNCEHSEINPLVYLNIPYIGKEYRRFVRHLAKIFYVKFDVKVCAISKPSNGDIFSANVAHISCFAQMSFTNLHVSVI